MVRRAVLALLIVACGATQTDPPDRPGTLPSRSDGGDSGSTTNDDDASTGPSVLDGGGDSTVSVGEDSGPSPRVDGPECTSSSSIPSPTPPANGLTLAASSVIGFSGTQGKCGWSYGYVAPATSSAFLLMGEYDANGENWYVQNTVYWTYMGRNMMHPNGLTTSGGRTAVDQFAVRRWTANYSGAIRITGLAKKPVGGNGTIARIKIGSNEAFSATVVDDAGNPFDVTANIAIGTTIDFVLEPNASDDGFDSTEFTAAIWK